MLPDYAWDEIISAEPEPPQVGVGPQRLAAGTEGICGFALSRQSMSDYLGCAGLV